VVVSHAVLIASFLVKKRGKKNETAARTWAERAARCTEAGRKALLDPKASARTRAENCIANISVRQEIVDTKHSTSGQRGFKELQPRTHLCLSKEENTKALRVLRLDQATKKCFFYFQRLQ